MSERKTPKDMIKDSLNELNKNDNLTNGEINVKKTLIIMSSEVSKGTSIIKKISTGNEQRKLLDEQDDVLRHYLSRLGIK